MVKQKSLSTSNPATVWSYGHITCIFWALSAVCPVLLKVTGCLSLFISPTQGLSGYSMACLSNVDHNCNGCLCCGGWVTTWIIKTIWPCVQHVVSDILARVSIFFQMTTFWFINGKKKPKKKKKPETNFRFFVGLTSLCPWFQMSAIW